MYAVLCTSLFLGSLHDGDSVLALLAQVAVLIFSFLSAIFSYCF